MSDYIPPELIPNILARLAVVDVLRCTSVCKSWQSLINSPSFASLHLNLSSLNQDPRLLVKYYSGGPCNFSYRVHRDSDTFDEIAEPQPPLSGPWQIIDSLNGLVCLYDYVERAIMLWNPSSRKSLILPKRRDFSGYMSAVGMSVVGFGFIPTSNEYKVVLPSYSNENKPQAEVYQLSTGSWRGIKPWDFPCTTLYYEQAYYNGFLHWFASCRESGNSRCFICSFDTKDEKFAALVIPSCNSIYDTRVCIKLSSFRESLCLIEYGPYGRDRICTMWIMKEYGVADSWEKLFSINQEQYNLSSFLYIRYNGELLFKKISETLSRMWREVLAYDCNNHQVKNLSLPTVGNISSVHTYVDSLVLIMAPNDVKVKEEYEVDFKEYTRFAAN